MADMEELRKNITEAKFHVAKQNVLAALYEKLNKITKEEELQQEWGKTLKEIKVQIATLLKSDNLSFLFGTGPSIPYGAVSVRKIPLELEHELCKAYISDENISDELKLFYNSVAFMSGKKAFTDPQILKRYKDLEKWCKKELKINEIYAIQTKEGLCVNLESLLDMLYRWFSSGLTLNELNDPDIFNKTGELKKRCVAVTGNKSFGINVYLGTLADLIQTLKAIFISLCKLPRENRAISSNFKAHKDFLKKILTRPLNLKRAKIFSVNYDTIIEQAMDSRGIFYLDGFIGKEHRYFRPECYEYDLYFPAGTTEGRVHRLDKVLHIYKLHGSINWLRSEEDSDNIYGLKMVSSDRDDYKKTVEKVIIYPTPRKYGEILGFPYSELLRRFAASIVQPQSVLFVFGYSFGDSHINNIILQALTIPSFTLVIVDPCDPDKNSCIKSLIETNDSRIYVFSGELLGCFDNFVQYAMPDLHEIEVSKKVYETYKALGYLRNNTIEEEENKDGSGS